MFDFFVISFFEKRQPPENNIIEFRSCLASIAVLWDSGAILRSPRATMDSSVSSNLFQCLMQLVLGAVEGVAGSAERPPVSARCQLTKLTSSLTRSRVRDLGLNVDYWISRCPVSSFLISTAAHLTAEKHALHTNKPCWDSWFVTACGTDSCYRCFFCTYISA